MAMVKNNQAKQQEPHPPLISHTEIRVVSLYLLVGCFLWLVGMPVIESLMLVSVFLIQHPCYGDIMMQIFEKIAFLIFGVIILVITLVITFGALLELYEEPTACFCITIIVMLFGLLVEYFA